MKHRNIVQQFLFFTEAFIWHWKIFQANNLLPKTINNQTTYSFKVLLLNCILKNF